MSSDSKPSSRVDLESARLGMKVVQGAPPVGGAPVDGPDGTFHDKPAPDGPPVQKAKQIPPHLKGIVNFFQSIIADEALLLEMCLDQTMIMVQEAINARAHGIDFFAGAQGDGGSSFTPGHYATIAGPMACELYKEVLKAIEGRAAEYEQLLKEATREREKATGKPPSGIIIAKG